MHYPTLEMTFITLSTRSDKLKMVKFAFWLPSLGGFCLALPKTAGVKVVIFLKYRGKVKIFKIGFLLPIISSSGGKLTLRNTNFHSKIFFEQYFLWFTLSSASVDGSSPKLVWSLGDPCGNVIGGFALLQSYLTPRQRVWSSRNGYFLCF